MINTTIIAPAYGRTYADKAAVLKDWNEGKDFRMMQNGAYCSIRDIADLHYMTTVYIVVASPKIIVEVSTH
jgi:hypothetical protein